MHSILQVAAGQTDLRSLGRVNVLVRSLHFKISQEHVPIVCEAISGSLGSEPSSVAVATCR